MHAGTMVRLWLCDARATASLRCGAHLLNDARDDFGISVSIDRGMGECALRLIARTSKAGALPFFGSPTAAGGGARDR